MKKSENISSWIIMFFTMTVLLTNMVNSFAEEKTPKIDIISLSVTKPSHSTSFGVGTSIELEFKLKQNIMQIDSKESKLIAFTDDQGTDLIDKGIQWRQQQTYFTTRTENEIGYKNSKIKGNIISVPINVTATPVKYSKNIHIKANLVLYLYPPDNTEKFETDILGLPAVSGKLSFSDYYAKFYKSGTGSHMGGPPLTFFKFNTNAVIYRFSFYDAQGKELKVIRHPNPKAAFTLETDIVSKVMKVKIQYTEPIKINIPVDIKTGIGLGNTVRQ